MLLKRMKSGVLGLAAGDALALPVEGVARAELDDQPVRSMRGCGSRIWPAGSWSISTTQTMAMLDSLKGGFDPEDMLLCLSRCMQGRYWAFGEPIGMDPYLCRAVERRAQGLPAAQCGDDRVPANGALRRMLPMAFYLYPMAGTSIAKSPHAMEMIRLASAITNGHPRTVVACGLYVGVACALISGMDIPEALQDALTTVAAYYRQSPQAGELSHFRRLMDVAAFRSLKQADVCSGPDAVQTLEAALYCLINTHSFEACALMAVNLGGQTCAVASAACALAGLYYGASGIPARWRILLPGRGEMENLCNQFHEEAVLRA